MAILCCVAQKAASAAQVDRGIWCRNILFFWRIGRKEALVLKLPFLPVNYLLAGFSSAVYNWLNMFPLYFFDTISEFKKRGIAESPPPPHTQASQSGGLIWRLATQFDVFSKCKSRQIQAPCGGVLGSPLAGFSPNTGISFLTISPK
jgi:hypothetical protein